VFLEVSPAEAEGVLDRRAARAPPAFLIGGADLLRWGLRQVQAGKGLEVQGQRRLTRRAVDRWFLRVREFGFDGDELERISQLTRGVPFLLDLFDHTLQVVLGTDGGVNVGRDDFERAAAKYERQLPEHLDRLVAGPEPIQLSARERQLLLMAVVAAREANFQQSSVIKDLQEYWDAKLFEDAWAKGYPELVYPPGYSDTVDDRLAARVLADLGLVPHPLDQTNSQGVPYLDADDPLVRVIAPTLARARGRA
jgi:hypothetical protein